MLSKESIKDSIKPVLKSHGVLRASLFGSIIWNDQNSNSDIDILVEFEKGRSLLDLVSLKMDLEEILGTKVDVITYNSIHPLLKDSILSSQEPVYG